MLSLPLSSFIVQSTAFDQLQQAKLLFIPRPGSDMHEKEKKVIYCLTSSISLDQANLK